MTLPGVRRCRGWDELVQAVGRPTGTCRSTGLGDEVISTMPSSAVSSHKKLNWRHAVVESARWTATPGSANLGVCDLGVG
jgi:hypothetical protein